MEEYRREFFENSAITQINREVWLDERGYLHRKDAPATIGYYRSGKIRYKKWYSHGKRHRTDGPAVIRYYTDGTVEEESWFIDDILYPYNKEYHKNGVLKKIVYHNKNGDIHKEDGPARLDYDDKGNLLLECWYRNSNFYRIGGPAYTRFYENGNPKYELWLNEKSVQIKEIEYDEYGNKEESWKNNGADRLIETPKTDIELLASINKVLFVKIHENHSVFIRDWIKKNRKDFVEKYFVLF